VTEESMPEESPVEVPTPPPEAVAQADGEPPPEAVAQADGEPPEPAEADNAEPAAHAEAESAGPDAAPVVAEAHDAAKAKPQAPRKPRDPAVIRAFRSGQPMEGLIERVIKGGYEIRIGRCRGFCPHSQMDLHRVENPEEHVGKTFAFKIIQLRRGGEDVVVSRRALLESEHEEEMKSVRATLLEGAVMTGRVSRLTEFGAFVDLGAGVTGLVHLTELAHGRVVRAGDIVSVGDRVPVKITKLDEATGKISLSIKQAITDPWESVPTLFEVGKAYPGKAKRFADFGAFVELRRGIEALAPAREFPPSGTAWREGIEVDAVRDWIVIAVDAARRRITVLPDSEGLQALLTAPLEPGVKLEGRVVKAEVFGVFVWLGPGRVGMVPRVWSGAGEGAGFESRFPAGAVIPVEIVDVQEGGKRIRLSVQGVDRDAAEAARAAAMKPRQERAEFRPEPRTDTRAPRGDRRPPREDRPRRQEPRERQTPPPEGGGFGSHLGEALRAALKRD
jgi:small subunit ribosomal protein S1